MFAHALFSTATLSLTTPLDDDDKDDDDDDDVTFTAPLDDDDSDDGDDDDVCSTESDDILDQTNLATFPLLGGFGQISLVQDIIS